MKWYLAVLKQYATFSGRASRSEYWSGDNEYGPEPGSDLA